MQTKLRNLLLPLLLLVEIDLYFTFEQTNKQTNKQTNAMASQAEPSRKK